jgi:outer membrane biosynthesis protein TonB
MKVKEVTNPEEQLGLLRVIIDNTWSAIKQQADAQARQKASQPASKPKVKTSKPAKQAPYASKPKPLPKPKPKPLYPAKPQPVMKSTIGKAVYKQPQVNIGAQKLTSNNQVNQAGASLSNLEKDEVLNLSRGALPKPL